ncbi:MAG TPA: hypothetical protein VLG15_12255 [Thermoanaerobaculia bacterium]|nr:hypothetical protein [Thermoanaerobaculia bacterium]
MSGQRVRGLLTLAVFLAIGWWIYEKQPTVSGFVDTITRPLLGSRVAVKESERKRVVGDASQVVALGIEKPVETVQEGMSESEVRRLLGEPDEINRIEDERGDRVRWTYRGADRVVVFHRNRVVSIAIR